MPEARPCAKETILRLFEEQGMERLDDRNLSRLHTLAVAALPENRISRSYVTRVVMGAGKLVRVKDAFAGAGLAEPYRTDLEHLLQFDTLEHAEGTLQVMTQKLDHYRSGEDRRGVEAVRAIALLGKRRAAAAARRARDPFAKWVKAEIAEWFTLWLYDPGSFSDWLLLRKRSPDFRNTFG